MLQVPGCSSGIIQLTARIQPSVALYHWQLFHYAKLRSLCNYSAAWQAAIEQYVCAHKYHEQQLPPSHDIAAVKATTRMLLPLHCPPNSDRAAPVLPTALRPVKPLLQLTQILLSQVNSGAADTQAASKTSSSSEPDSTQQTKTYIRNPVTSSPADELALLQTVLLVLKLISLASAVTVFSESISTAVMALWKILVNTTETLRDIQDKAGGVAQAGNKPMDEMRLERPSHLEAWADTVVALIKLLMTELRQCLVMEGMSDQADTCSVTLASLLDLLRMKQSYCCAVAVSTAIQDPGTSPFSASPHSGFSAVMKCSHRMAVHWAAAAVLTVQSLLTAGTSHFRALQQWPVLKRAC